MLIPQCEHVPAIISEEAQPTSNIVRTAAGDFIVATSPVEKKQAALDLEIPVVDMDDFYNSEKREQFLNTLYRAMTEIGFFAVRNTGVDSVSLKKAYQESENFFRQDASYKMQCFNKQFSGQRGFVPGETAKGSGTKDRKEFYHIGRELPDETLQELGIAKNIWPEQSDFKDAMVTLYNELNRYVVPLQEAIVSVINERATTKVPLDFFQKMTQNGDTLLRALYYPALTLEQMQSQQAPLFWAAEHTDIDLLAILPFATEKGLQVQIKGKWHNVIVPSDAFIVNIGDMLQNLSNGLFVSARHRVLAQEPLKDRFSMVLFVHPLNDTSLAPLQACIEQTGGVQKYADGTRKEFLWERLLELGIAPALLGPYSETGHTERQIKYGRQSPQVVDLLVKNHLASDALLEALDSP